MSKLITEISKDGRRCIHMPTCDVDVSETGLIPDFAKRKTPTNLPQVAEIDLVRHYTELSRNAHGVDNGFYPLGSCTMKYNPRVNEAVAANRQFTDIHPLQPEYTVKGCLDVLGLSAKYLCELTGMDQMSMQPAAGAHGEFTGLLLIKAYHKENGDEKRKIMLVPDSAHGTNPASAGVAGFDVMTVPSAPNGGVDIEALKSMVGDDTAGFMLTNPNTLGLFDKNILEITDIIHSAGGLLYYDGANLNAIMGITRPGDMGFDVLHLNLHKTFSTPHGGGGPGSGPVGCKKFLAKFLPVPVVVAAQDGYRFDYDRPDSIGKVKSFYGNFGVVVRALTYILTLGRDGLKEASLDAVLNANYMMAKLSSAYNVPYEGPCMHEFVMSADRILAQTGCSAMDIAKSLLDYGIHPPTIYFPLTVREALMVEPTETESKETLDEAIDIFIKIAEKAKDDPDSLHNAPTKTPVRRLDELTAARKPILKAD